MFVRFIWIRWLLFILVIIKSTFSDEYCNFNCTENGVCIKDSSVCDGIEDCPHGSDETYVNCKSLSDFDEQLVFFCANGAKIDDNMKCDIQVDCADKSDEAPAMCNQEFDKVAKGNCSDNEIQCTSTQCISKDKKCDGTVDCLNGRDESVELCMGRCDYPNFQCGNGKCISDNEVCDNKYDCIDGSDELISICNNKRGWATKYPVTCMEPTEDGLKFTADTKFYLHSNKSQFVYPNMPVRFECYDRSINMTGNEWNLCMLTGKWRNEPPMCKTKTKWINTNPDTNGTNGCPLDTYLEYKDKLIISKCESNGNCLTRVKPPINNMSVTFDCDIGYTLYPARMSKNPIRCNNKQWFRYHLFENPRCYKMCDAGLLYCRDSMIPYSCELNRKGISCNNSNSFAPKTLVNFTCKPGFKINPNGLTLFCQENGIWRNTTNMDSFCTLDCGEQDKTGLTRNAPSIRPPLSPWSVAIFLYKPQVSNYEHVCGGVLIRHNVVLTAAHCVCVENLKTLLDIDLLRLGPSNSNNSIVSSDFGWSVQEIVINIQYEPRTYTSDTALIRIKERMEIPITIICLPWLNNGNMERIQIGFIGNVVSWDTRGMEYSSPLRLTIVQAKVKNVTDHKFAIKTISNYTICKGDSGSGFVSECDGVSEKCLYGIVSSKYNGASANLSCTTDVLIANTAHIGAVDFIKEYLGRISNTCDQLDYV